MTENSPEPAPTEVEIRQELGSILDALSQLPHGALEDRASLRARQAQLRALLQGTSIEDADAIKTRWDERAGSKAEETVTPVIISPGEGGQAGGA
jgi:hypothetical protein